MIKFNKEFLNLFRDGDKIVIADENGKIFMEPKNISDVNIQKFQKYEVIKVIQTAYFRVGDGAGSRPEIQINIRRY